MKLLQAQSILQLLSCLIIFALSEDVDSVEFLEDFFINRNARLTINTCWTKNEIKAFYRGSVQNIFKQVAVHRKLSLKALDEFFNDLSGSNWFLLDFVDCPVDEMFLKAIDERMLFRYPLKYLILINEENYYDLLKLITPYNILPMSNIIIACFQESLIKLYQPYKIGDNGSLIIENYGTWMKEHGITISQVESFTDRRRNFQNYTIKISTVVNNNESIYRENIDDITEFRSDEPYFFQEIPNMFNLMQYLNASYEFRVFNSYGYLNHTTGKFNGLAQDLFEENGHISGTSLILSEERQQIIEYMKSYGYWSIKSKFILKKPSTSYVENIYYTTFENKVWIATLSILLIFAMVLYALLNWEIKNMDNHKYKKYTLSDVSLLSLEAICQQGTYLDSKTYSGRTIILIMFTASMFIYIAYSSFILVLLQSTKPITSVRQLVDSRIECGGFNVSFMMAYYTLTKDPDLIELYQRKIAPNRFYSLEDGLKKVQEGNFAFQINLGPAYNYILKEFTNYDICKLQELRGYMNDEMYVAVPKNSQYKKLFKTGLLVIEERGLQSRVKNRMSAKPKCYNEAGNFQSVRIYDCYSVIILFTIGVCISLIVLVVEIVVAKNTKN